MSDFYRGKRVLVTGATGMIGRHVADLLVKRGAIVVTCSIDNVIYDQYTFCNYDLMNQSDCYRLCDHCDCVFHVAGVKGSPKMNIEQPANFFDGNAIMGLNMLRAAKHKRVKRYLFVSSIGVYNFSIPILFEDSVWDNFPSKYDWYPGWAKRICELQIGAYKEQFGNQFESLSIVRPSNVFGEYDNFNPETAMAVPALIARIVSGENPLKVWGNGSNIRDFIYAGDVARCCIEILEKGIEEPLNVGSGYGCSIKDLIFQLQEIVDEKFDIKYDLSKPSGDPKRVLSVDKIRSYGIEPNRIVLVDGLRRTYEWYKANKNLKRHEFFKG